MRCILRAVVMWALLALIPISVWSEAQPPYDSVALHQLLTAEHANDCPDFIYNAKKLFRRLDQSGHGDSIWPIIDFVQSTCDPEVFRPLETLHSIEASTFGDAGCDSTWLELFLSPVTNQYRYRGGWDGLSPWAWYDWQGHNTRDDSSYQEFLKAYADRVMKTVDSTSMEYLICRYYKGERQYAVERAKSGSLGGNCFQVAFDRLADSTSRALRHWRSHAAINAGVWGLAGDADPLGPKLELGGQLGVRGPLIGLDFTLLLRVGNATSDYTLIDHDGPVTSDKFFGGYLGFDVPIHLANFGRSDWEAFVGFGYDGFGVQDQDVSADVNAFAFNVGLSPRIMTNKQRNRFVGIQVRYNWVQYGSHGGTDIADRSISVNVIFGYLGNSGVTWLAERLGLYDK
jgi:hypothetical protein